MDEIRYKKILFDNEKILSRVNELGKKISSDYQGKELVILGVLKGSLFFFTDLARAIDLPLQLDMIAIGNIPDMTKSTGIVRITKDVENMSSWSKISSGQGLLRHIFFRPWKPENPLLSRSARSFTIRSASLSTYPSNTTALRSTVPG